MSPTIHHSIDESWDLSLNCNLSHHFSHATILYRNSKKISEVANLKKWQQFFKSVFIGIIFSLIGGLQQVYATDKTQAEGLKWAQSQIGKSIDADGWYGEQCVDFVLAYYDYLGVPRSQGNGADYAYNTLPKGWKRIPKSRLTFKTQATSIQPGDIAVFVGGYGHVAIVEEATAWNHTSLHQNYAGADFVKRLEKLPYNDYLNQFWGVIRPNWYPEAPFVSLEAVELPLSYKKLAVGQTYTVNPVFTPLNASNQIVKWRVLDNTIASVSAKGTVRALKEGTTEIIGVSQDNGQEIRLKVVNQYVQVQKVTVKLPENEKKLKVGQSMTASATITPTNASEKKVKWVSSNPKNATVSSSGVIKAKRPSKVKITAVTQDGKKQSSVTITITK